MVFHAPAKVNLSLRILGKRADGFHDIETIMAPLSLSDTLDIELQEGSGVDFTCSDASLPCDGTNLVCRAVDAFARHTGRQFRTRVHLTKNIPHGAGLGGGSSDAATVLKALDLTLGTRLSICELESIAASLGSDIPFFIRSSPSLCRGRGEIVEPLGILPKANILLVKPPFPVPTAWAYQAYKNKTKTSETFSQWHGSIELMNDLEEPVFSKYLVLPVLKRWLLDQSGVRCAMMSGSGSTIFAILNEDVLDLEDRVLAYFGSSFLVRRCQLLGTPHTDHC